MPKAKKPLTPTTIVSTQPNVCLVCMEPEVSAFVESCLKKTYEDGRPRPSLRAVGEIVNQAIVPAGYQKITRHSMTAHLRDRGCSKAWATLWQ